MKKTVFTAYVALLLSLLMPLAGRALPASEKSEAPPVSAAPSPPAHTPTAEIAPGPIAGEDGPDTPPPTEGAALLTIRLLTEETVLELPLEEYLTGVLAAEMPASYPMEALKAQAVAARTYALYCADGGKHSQADVCADPGCCQAWQNEEAMESRWGADFEANRARLRQAVSETEGQILLYEGRPVFAAFHASSPGRTEDCGQVWNPRPYLVSVSSPETEETVPGLESSLRCEALDFRDTILSAYPQADFSAPPEDWLGQAEYDESGRVAELSVGGLPLRGTELRSLFHLRSAAFSLRFEEGAFVFTVLGSGHGVGMSQVGARLMAEGGADYREILNHYYTATELSCISG